MATGSYDASMQHVKYILPLLGLSACVALAETSPEVVCRQLRAALSNELSALASMQDAASTEAALPKLEAALVEMAEMDRSAAAEKSLWGYIDNTQGVKAPFVELLERLAIEFARLENASYYGSEKLRQLLAPQVIPPSKAEVPAGTIVPAVS